MHGGGRRTHQARDVAFARAIGHARLAVAAKDLPEDGLCVIVRATSGIEIDEPAPVLDMLRSDGSSKPMQRRLRDRDWAGHARNV